ncbi:MAG: DEAD/DEAH box helicase [Bacteroidetes bacterium HGW-Bacteroidetes-16]|nr:MAG: DEAD/DEAH box helicase [Bacteroidetes bacterium HGW-Bacteroidetes-16]
MTFSDLGISENIVRALHDNHITIPTEIQIKAIPHILQKNQDLVAVAQTGTGKTAAFCLPILQSINPKFNKIQALVLVPTRELGQQVAREFFLFSKYLPRVFAEPVYGGASIDEQIEKLIRPTHVVVATPGRLIDLLERNALSLNDLNYLVLDEADEMINMGFKAEIDEILKSCKEGITRLLFTATMPKDVREMINEYMADDAVEIRINAEELVNQKIEHQYLIYKKGLKLEYLKAFLNERTDQRGILFCRTKIAAKRLSKQLAGFVIATDAIHGNLNQESREKVLRGFKNHRINLLVATDIAARGIDVKNLDYIVHYRLPENTEQYTHRSGRTARAGKSGVSVSFVQKEELNEIKSLETKLNIQFSALEVTIEPETQNSPPITIFMNMGTAQDFDSVSLKDFLAEEAGLDHAEIRNVVVEEHRSHFDVPEKYQVQILANLNGFKRSHRNIRLSLTNSNAKRDLL